MSRTYVVALLAFVRNVSAEARAALERVSREAAEDPAAVARGALKIWKTRAVDAA